MSVSRFEQPQGPKTYARRDIGPGTCLGKFHPTRRRDVSKTIGFVPGQSAFVPVQLDQPVPQRGCDRESCFHDRLGSELIKR